MAYTNAGNAFFRFTSFVWNAISLLGKISFRCERHVDREVLQTDGINYPEIRPVDNEDSRMIVEGLDQSAAFAYTDAAANATMGCSEANGGGSAGIVLGKFVFSAADHSIRRRSGGNPVQYVFELATTTLTFTPTV